MTRELCFCGLLYCITKIVIAIKRHSMMLEAMTASDMLPFMCYAHACVAMLLTTCATHRASKIS